MSGAPATLTACQYTDMMLGMGTDHVAAAAGADGIVLLAIPLLWMVGVVAFIALKLRSR